MGPRVANKRPSCRTRVIHKNVGMSSKVGFLSEKNSKRVFEAESIDEVFEKQFGEKTPARVRNETLGPEPNDVVEKVSIKSDQFLKEFNIDNTNRETYLSR